MLLVNSFDLEPWWTVIPPVFNFNDWDKLPDRSDYGLQTFLDLCDQYSVKATFFVVGWYAKKYPGRIASIVNRGHDIGCHSLAHNDIRSFSIEEFRKDTQVAKNYIEDVAGIECLSYRAPSFSFDTERFPLLTQTLYDLGFKIDSSVSNSLRFYGGGFSQDFNAPMHIKTLNGNVIFEIPAIGRRIAGKNVQYCGGGYLRALPIFMLRRFIYSDIYQVLYLHPHDFDKDTPVIPNSSALDRLRRKISIGNLEQKLSLMYESCQVMSCLELYRSIGD
jgi:polysaccharide deacetylase family protein (PEP-CTERM system associated)